MPDKDSRYHLYSLKMLHWHTLTINRANECDLNFLKNILNYEACPEYNRFNTALIMNEDVAVQPPTQVTYIPFINLNPANPETTVTPMYKLR